MEQHPVYTNPFDDFALKDGKLLKLHRFAFQDHEVLRFVPNLSPFPIKLEAYLRFAGIPYEIVLEAGTANAPRGKMPFISAGDVKLSDSDLIIAFLKERIYDPDAALSSERRTIGHLVQRTLEDHLYWITLYYEFSDDDGWRFFAQSSFGPDGPGLDAVRGDFLNRTWGQGVARYTADEIVEKATKDLQAIANILQDNKHLLGTPHPTSFDAVVFGMTLALFQTRALHPRLTDIARGISNLSRYMRDLIETYFPELQLAF